MICCLIINRITRHGQTIDQPRFIEAGEVARAITPVFLHPAVN